MITFKRTFKYALVREIFIHPRIWPYVSDDGSPAPDDYRVPEDPNVWYVLVLDVGEAGAELLGCWTFHPHNLVCWEVHTCLLPVAWGDTGLEAGRAVIRWVWQNTPCRRIITNVAITNRLALHFARNAGLKEYGLNEKSWLKGGKLIDQVCLGISRPVGMPLFEPQTVVETREQEGEGMCLSQQGG